MTIENHNETPAAVDRSTDAKEVWVKPEIVDYKPVTIAQGVSYRIGDGVSNLS